MKTLTKAAISAAAVMAITTSALALTASAAVSVPPNDFPLSTDSINGSLTEIYDTSSSVRDYSATDYTEEGHKAFFCANSSGRQITTNAISEGKQSSMDAIQAYASNYKWCGVCLTDTVGRAESITSLRYENKPNNKTVNAELSSAQLNNLGHTIKEGIYVFQINESNSTSSSALSANRLWITLKY